MEIISQKDYRTYLLFRDGITAMTGDKIPENYQELDLVSLDISDGYDESGGLTATLSDGSEMWLENLGVRDEQSANVWVTLAEAKIINVSPEILRKALKTLEKFEKAMSEYEREMEALGMEESYEGNIDFIKYVYCVPGLSREFLKFPLT